MIYCNCSSNAGSVLFAQLPLWHINRGLTGRMLCKVIHMTVSSIRIPHQILMAAVSFGNV